MSTSARIALLLPLALACLMACGSSTEPTGIVAGTVVPAGEADPAWADIGKSCTTTSLVYPVPAGKRDSLPPFTHGPTRSDDDDWADLTRSTPGGWGGIWLENNTPTIFLVNVEKRDEVVAALRARGWFPQLDLTKTVAKPGRWDFAQLADWYRYFDLYIFGLSYFRAGDIKESKNRLQFEVTDGAARSAFEGLLKTMDLPCYLVAITTSGA